MILTTTPYQLAIALAAPFDPSEVHFKPAAVSGNRALAIAFVDARTIQDRLDQVLGVDGWQDDYECLPDGSVVCRLRLRLGGEWITKVDVGSPSEQPDGGDRLKAAFSDALKRVAVKFSVGRYLYRLPSQWVDYDPKKKQFVKTPQLSAWALPGKGKGQPASQMPPAKEANGSGPKPHAFPRDGSELESRLADYDQDLAEQGLIAPGDLLGHVGHAVAKAGHGTDVRKWGEQAMRLAIQETKKFEQEARAKAERKERTLQHLQGPVSY